MVTFRENMSYANKSPKNIKSSERKTNIAMPEHIMKGFVCPCSQKARAYSTKKIKKQFYYLRLIFEIKS